MSDHNKQLALDAMAIIAEGRLELVEPLVHPEYHNHEASADRPGGPEGFKQNVASLRGVFSGIHFEQRDVIAGGDRVVIRGHFSVRQVGPWAGMPATGRRLSIQQIHIWRIVDQRLIEHWAIRDQLEGLRQLGLLHIRGPGRGEAKDKIPAPRGRTASAMSSASGRRLRSARSSAEPRRDLRAAPMGLTRQSSRSGRRLTSDVPNRAI
jgi:predicted ester cyclase